MKAFSSDLRQRILDADDAGEGSPFLGVKKLPAPRKAAGAIEPIPRPGRTPIFHGELLAQRDACEREHPDARLEEIRRHFGDRAPCWTIAEKNASGDTLAEHIVKALTKVAASDALGWFSPHCSPYFTLMAPPARKNESKTGTGSVGLFSLGHSPHGIAGRACPRFAGIIGNLVRNAV